jgi:hypothetical protein
LFELQNFSPEVIHRFLYPRKCTIGQQPLNIIKLMTIEEIRVYWKSQTKLLNTPCGLKDHFGTSKHLKERNHLEDLSVNIKIELKWGFNT